MQVNIVGGGPAGLYAGISIKKNHPDFTVRVYEQNPQGATFGFGVVFSDTAMDFLSQDDPETSALIEPHMLKWSDIVVNHPDEKITIDGIGFAGIGRLELLELLVRRAKDLGVECIFESRISHLSDLPKAELVIGADGLNSLVRNSSPEIFNTSIREYTNYFVWYGANREYDTLTQTFINTPIGPMNAHHYNYAKGRATFIIEIQEEIFNKSGFKDLDEPDYRKLCETYFSDVLKGVSLVPNNSTWRRFPYLKCEKWFAGNMVLVGDALQTAHFSIGSGTRLALEDVIALMEALRQNDWSVDASLAAYQQSRQPIRNKIAVAADKSAFWYEDYPNHMSKDPWEMAHSYMSRAGRIDAQRLKKISPVFAQELESRCIGMERAG